MVDEQSINIIKTAFNSKPIEDQIKDLKETIDELFNSLVPIMDGEDYLYEFDKFKKAYEDLVKLYQMESYREGFHSGIKLFTR